MRVSPELIRVSDGTARWQQPFDAALTDVFQVQADIASRVAEALNLALNEGARQQLAQRPTRNVDAYDAFLRGEQLSLNGIVSDAVPLRKAIAEYERAVALDPSFAQAWAQLSRAACSIAGSTPTPADLDRCHTGAERAVALGPDRPESRLAMGSYFRNVAKDFDKALEQYTLGLQAAPNHADLLAASAVIERTAGKFEDALAHLRRASQLDPRSVPAASSLARTFHDLHRHSEAQREYARAVSLAPTNLAVVQGQATDFLSQGDLAGARAVIADALKHADATAVVTRFATFQEMMWVLPDDLRAKVVDLQPSDFDTDRGMWALKVGGTFRLMGDAAQARSYGEIAATAYREAAKRYPGDAQQTGTVRSRARARRTPGGSGAGGRAIARAPRNGTRRGERSLLQVSGGAHLHHGRPVRSRSRSHRAVTVRPWRSDAGMAPHRSDLCAAARQPALRSPHARHDADVKRRRGRVGRSPPFPESAPGAGHATRQDSSQPPHLPICSMDDCPPRSPAIDSHRAAGNSG